MKKITILLLLAVTFTVNAQKNELKLDVFDILALKTLDVSFEHILNSESSAGISVFFNFEDKADFRYRESFMLTPYYRQHLFDRGNINFFGEFFGALNKGDIKLSEEDKLTDKDDSYMDFAFGLGFGGKYVSDNGFLIDFHAGIGRNLFNSSVSREIVPRVGISVGKQF